MLANDSDPDGDMLTVTDFDDVSAGGSTVSIASDGAVTYTPATAFFGGDSFAYTVDDGNGGQSTTVVRVTVTGPAIDITDLVSGANGFSLDGESDLDQSGRAVAGRNDINGDGFDDVIIGAPLYGISAGRSYVVFGGEAVTDVELWRPTIGMGGFALDGENNDWAATSVSTFPDLNRDGRGELGVGAIFADPPAINNGGRAFFVLGPATTTPITLTDVGATVDGQPLDGQAGGSRTGTSVANAGDVNGDGFADVLVGAPYYSDGGRAYVIFGQLDMSSVDPFRCRRGQRRLCDRRLDGRQPWNLGFDSRRR